MGVRFPSVATILAAGSLAGNGAESAIWTTPPLTQPLPSAQVIIIWEFLGNVGNGTTNIAAKIRRGSGITGPVVNSGNAFVVTPNTISKLNGCYVDNPGDTAGLQYTLTFTGTATTGVGSTVEGCMIAFCL
jgi:hypothetical protein